MYKKVMAAFVDEIKGNVAIAIAKKRPNNRPTWPTGQVLELTVVNQIGGLKLFISSSENK